MYILQHFLVTQHQYLISDDTALFTSGKKTNKLVTCLKLHNMSVAQLFNKQAPWLPSPALFSLASSNISRIWLIFASHTYNGDYHLSRPNCMPGTMLSPVWSFLKFSQYPCEARTVISFWQVMKTWRREVNKLPRVTKLVSDKAGIQIQVCYYSLQPSPSILLHSLDQGTSCYV